MPDAIHPQRAPIGRWNDAFAALPLEAPPDGGWARVEARLRTPSTTPARRWPTWLAVAAALALAVGLPVRWMSQHADPATDNSVVATTPGTTASRPVQPDLQAPNPSTTAPATQFSSADTNEPSKLASRDSRPEPARVATAQAQETTGPAAAIASPTRPSSATTAPDALASSAAASSSPAIADSGQADQQELDRLYADSARLEALLAVARDEHVASASAAVISDHYDDRIGSIDAALAQPTLTTRQRLGLWRDRVATLQQLADFESTQRVLAAYGERDDMRLVSIN